MAISLRRALISSKTLFPVLRAASIRSHHTINSFNLERSKNQSSAVFDRVLNSPAPPNFYQLEFRRGFAKGRKQQKKELSSEEDEDEEDDEMWDEGESEEDEEEEERTVDLGGTVKASAVSQMNKAVDALSRELTKLQTGRASQGMLDHIMVDIYGVKTPLNRIAVVSVMDPKTLSVTPHDPNALNELEKAIISSPLGLNPKSDNGRLIAPIPPLTKQHMQAVCKVVAKSAEDVKQSIRRARQKALDSIKKAIPKKEKKEKDNKAKDKDKAKAKAKAKPAPVSASISEDDAKRLEKEIDELTKKYIKSAEDMCKAKEKEIKGE